MPQNLAKSRRVHVEAAKAREARKVAVLDTLLEKNKEGPLKLLYDCQQQRARVRVVTRHQRGIKGVVIGFLVAFDKHMNMVRSWSCRYLSSALFWKYTNHASGSAEQILRDVDEKYAVLLKITRETAPGRQRLCRKQEQRTRHLAQILLRGESIVLVSKIV